MSSGIRQAWMLAGFVVVCFLAAAIGGRMTATSVTTWYPTLLKPAWTPPAWLFAPVWTTLYLMMAVSAWLVWRHAGWSGAIGIFAVQLALNVAWSFCFFGLRSPFAGLIDIALLWVTISGTLIWFWQIDRLAAYLLIPYLVWVTFAAALNFSIWKLN